MSIQDNYHSVVERIYRIAKSVGRQPDDIQLVVVTKTQPIHVVHEVIKAGAIHLGENYVEEATPKIQDIKNENIKWHMIGHVQSRKAASVCEYFQYMHSLDSLKLAERLSRHAIELNRVLPVMLEFNTGGEASKSGWNIWDDKNWLRVLAEIEKIFELPGINPSGVMTIPPYSENPEDSRPYYRRLKKFKNYISNHFHVPGFTDLSMGMSGDFEVAIQEGASWLRIGQAILGPRLK